MNMAEFLRSPEAFDPDSDVLRGPCDNDGNTALILAIKGDAGAAFQFMLDSAASPELLNHQNAKGVTALAVAAHKGRAHMVRELLAAGADVDIPNHNGSTALIQASHFGHADIVTDLIHARAQVDRPNDKGTTALMRAAQEGHLNVVARLLKEQCDVNRRNEDGMNALMLGSQRGHAEIVSLLIDDNAAIDGRTVQGSTALMLACKRGHFEVVRTLLCAGAELTVKDSRGRIARDQAARRGQSKILALLEPAKQMRLMQGRVRVERAHLLCRLHCLLHEGRATIHAGCAADSASLRALTRALGFVQAHDEATGAPVEGHTFETRPVPFGVYRLICEFLPLPRLWASELERLRKRIAIGANDVAVDGAFTLMNEVFCDLNLAPELRSNCLVRIARSPTLQAELRAGTHPIPTHLLERLVEWHDLQSTLSRLDSGISCKANVAEKVVSLARDVHSWYMWRDSPGLNPDPKIATQGGAVATTEAPFPPTQVTSGMESEEDEEETE